MGMVNKKEEKAARGNQSEPYSNESEEAGEAVAEATEEGDGCKVVLK